MAGLQQKPLLQHVDDDDESQVSSESVTSPVDHGPRRLRDKISYTQWALLIFQALLLGVYVILAIVFVHKIRALQSPTKANALAQDAIEYEQLEFDVLGFAHSPFVRHPGEEADKSWDDLIRYSNILLPQDYIISLGRQDQAVAYRDEGYVGTLTVFHDLHCLKYLFRGIHSEHYFPNLTDVEKRMLQIHSAHCIDMLRQSVMCQADIQVLTYRWVPDVLKPSGNQSSPHQCANWDTLNNWAREHSVDMREPGAIIHPILGPISDRLEDEERVSVGVTISAEHSQ